MPKSCLVETTAASAAPVSPFKAAPVSPFKLAGGIELGHTFLLGTKYSEPLNAAFHNSLGQQVLMQMGCYGIGVSRLLAAVAEASYDQFGLSWPASIAPFKLAVISKDSESLKGTRCFAIVNS